MIVINMKMYFLQAQLLKIKKIETYNRDFVILKNLRQISYLQN